MLTRLGGELSRQLESVAAGERRLNGLGPYSGGRTLHLREEARLVRAEEAAVRAEVSERQDRVGALTDELRTLEDAAEEMNDKLVDAADKHSDPTRLCKTRSAIRQLKADVQAMDVLVGVNSAKLMGKQLRREQAAWKAAGRAPAGSRWGGLNAPARSRRESTRSPIFSATESSRSATLASSTLSTSPKRTTTPPTSAATTAPTSANSEPTSEEYDGGGNGGKREGGVVQQARKPPTEKVWSSTESSGRGQVLESRRSNVLIQAAVRLMTTKK